MLQLFTQIRPNLLTETPAQEKKINKMTIDVTVLFILFLKNPKDEKHSAHDSQASSGITH